MTTHRRTAGRSTVPLSPPGDLTNAPTVVADDVRYRQVQGRPKNTHSRAPTLLPMWYLNGKSWLDCPPPPRRHRHWAQVAAMVDNEQTEAWRCPCGAIGHPGRPWVSLEPPRVALHREWLAWLTRWWRQ